MEVQDVPHRVRLGLQLLIWGWIGRGPPPTAVCGMAITLTTLGISRDTESPGRPHFTLS